LAGEIQELLSERKLALYEGITPIAWRRKTPALNNGKGKFFSRASWKRKLPTRCR